MQTLVFVLIFVAAVVLVQALVRGRVSGDPHASADHFKRALAAIEPDGRSGGSLQRVPTPADTDDEAAADEGSFQ